MIFSNTSSARPLYFPEPARGLRIWAVGGGKGGVGKSMISSNLAIALARMGNRVLAVDLDLGGANLHTSLGIDLPQRTLNDFFSGRCSKLDQCMTSTEIQNLSLISGAMDSAQSPSLGAEERMRFLKDLSSLDVDLVIFDLGAGTASHTLDFFLAADLGIISILPEPTSIENAYRFIRSAFYQKLSRSPTLAGVRPLIEAAKDPKNSFGIRSPSDLYRELKRNHPTFAETMTKEIEGFKPKLIVNQTRTQADAEIGESVKSVCKKYFGIDMDVLGSLEHDSAAWQSVRKKRPLLLEFPHSKLSMAIYRIAQFTYRRFSNLRTPDSDFGGGR